MTRALAALTLLTASLTGCGAPERGTAGSGRPPSAARPLAPAENDGGGTSAPIASRRRIVFLGDSLTAGYGLDKAQSVPALIQQHVDREGYGYEVINAGVSGDTSAGGLSRLEWSLQGDVDVLVIELGANDGLRGLPVAGLKRNLEQVINVADTRGIKVLLTGMEAPPNYGSAYTREFREVYRSLARERNVVFVPFYLEGVAGIPELNIGDGIHPNAAGARIIEATIWRALEPMLEKRSS